MSEVISENYLLDLIGRSKENAISKLASDEFLYRVTREGSTHYMITCDFDPQRVNLEIENDVVVTAEV